MFTGIIQAVGNLTRKEVVGGDLRLTINAGTLDMSDVQLGDSIAVNGVCLTVVKIENNQFTVDVSKETISLTSLKDLNIGGNLNLEKALLPTTRLGGHLVSGHVDGLGEVIDITEDARSTRYTVRAPAELRKYIAAKGSVCIDGVSLTVNHVDTDSFDINIIPHTKSMTIIASYSIGTHVNLEVDLIARYLEQLIKSSGIDEKGVTIEMLSKSGFL